MNKFKWFVLAACLLGLSATLPAEEATLIGEVVDQGCYLRNESHGPEHQECAARCLKNGNPAGVLTDDGELFTLASTASAFETFAAKRVRVEGKRVDRTVFATSLEVWENDAWVTVPLNKFGAPEREE